MEQHATEHFVSFSLRAIPISIVSFALAVIVLEFVLTH
jgi:hypothetical protein